MIDTNPPTPCGRCSHLLLGHRQLPPVHPDFDSAVFLCTVAGCSCRLVNTAGTTTATHNPDYVTNQETQ